MRRTVAVLLLLLTESMARAGVRAEDFIFSPLTCCSALLFIFALAFIGAMAIYDLRNARRSKPPPPGE